MPGDCNGNLSLTDKYGQTEVSIVGLTCVCLWESQYEGVALG